MLGTYFYDGQGLGNQLWSYYAIRLLAKRFGMPYSILGFDCFKGSRFLSINRGEYIHSPHRIEPSSELFLPFEHYFSERQVVVDSEFCDVRPFDERVYGIQENTLVDGYFQSEQMVDLVPHQLSEFIQLLDLPHLDYLCSSDICILNIRGGHYKKNKRLTLHEQYWRNAMEIMKRERNVKSFLIVTDDVKYARGLFPFIPVLEQDTHHDFVSLSKAKNLILSNSSFSYFPIRLNGSDPYVIAPKYWARHNVSDGFWACRSNIYAQYRYLDRNGRLSSAIECEIEADDYIAKNASRFKTVCHDFVAKHPVRLISFFKNRFITYG